jgi:hypothetical protein
MLKLQIISCNKWQALPRAILPGIKNIMDLEAPASAQTASNTNEPPSPVKV